MIVTLDTNVLISGFLFDGPPSEIVEAAIAGTYTLAVSPAILSELEGVLSRSKFGLDPYAVHMLVRDLESAAVVIHPKIAHHLIIEDPSDNAIVDCAVETQADYIVSGDHHLLSLETAHGIPVFSPAKFLEILSESYTIIGIDVSEFSRKAKS